MAKEKITKMQKEEIVEDIKEEGKVSEKIAEAEEKIAEEVAKEETGEKNKVQKKTVIKKDTAKVDIRSAPISTKYAIEICRFIKYKKIEDAIAYLEQVKVKKKVMPMRGEFAHQKGKGIMSGKYPKNASEHFIMMLKSLMSNSTTNGIDEPVIVEAIATRASRPRGRFGRWQRKAVHVLLRAASKESIKKIKKAKK